jgi:hypothetical protein
MRKNMNNRFLVGIAVGLSAVSMLATAPALASDKAKKAVVLVHGGFVDGSGWEACWLLSGRRERQSRHLCVAS